MSNETATFLSTADNMSPLVEVSIGGLEAFNMVLLFLVTNGFYQGIEIQHPLYAVLFLNLVLSLANSTISVLGWMLLPFKIFVRLLNSLNVIHVFSMCSNWSVISIIRYVYILHENWLHTAMPSPTMRWCTAIGLSLFFTLLQSSPVIAIAIILGKRSNLNRLF